MDEEQKNKNIFSLVKYNPKKKEKEIVHLTLRYSNGTIEHESCHWFGESVEIPGLFIFGYDGAEVPTALINLEHVLRIDVEKKDG